MNRMAISLAGVVTVLVLITLAFSLYTVDETESALVLQFGEPQASVTEPGLHFKVPFIQNVRFFDARIRDYDHEARTYVTSDKKNLIIDSYAKWRIEDPLQFYITVQNSQGARSRLGDLIRSKLREEIGKRDLQETVSGERTQVMAELTKTTSQQAASLGIQVRDVRIKRTDLPKENERAVFDRMASERERKAREYRAEGAEQAEEIMAKADRRRSEILARARRKAEETKGQADAKATSIYSQAYGKDPEFFALYRTLQTYEKSFGSNEVMVLSPDSKLFRFFGQSGVSE